MNFPAKFSIETASRSDIVDLIEGVVAGTPAFIERLDINKGDDDFGALALLLSSASGNARLVFGKALNDIIHSLFEMAREHDDNGLQFRALDLLEVVLAENIGFDREPVLDLLRRVIEQNLGDLRIAALRTLSYFGSEPRALKTLREIYETNPSNPTVTAYLTTAYAIADPLSALEIRFDVLDPQVFNTAPELILAIQSAIWRMFEEDGRLARLKTRALAKRWPRPLILLAHEILTDDPMKFLIPANLAAIDLYKILEPIDDKQSPVGIAARAINRGAIVCYDGYTMTAAAGPGEFETHHKPWMSKLAEIVSDIVFQRYSQKLEIKHNKWPQDARWRGVMDSLKLQPFGGRRSSPNVTRTEGGKSPLTAEICFEMFSVDLGRSSEFEVVEFGSLRTFSLLFHASNTTVRDALKLDLQTSEDFEAAEDRYYQRAQTDIVSFLQALRDREKVPHIIRTPVYSVASDLIANLAKESIWKEAHFLYANGPQELLLALEEKLSGAIVICDNTIANVVWKRAQNANIFLKCVRFDYPEPIPVGLAYDTNDRSWGDILQEAMEMTLVDPDASTKASLMELFDGLEALDANPGTILSRALRRHKQPII